MWIPRRRSSSGSTRTQEQNGARAGIPHSDRSARPIGIICRMMQSGWLRQSKQHARTQTLAIASRGTIAEAPRWLQSGGRVGSDDHRKVAQLGRSAQAGAALGPDQRPPRSGSRPEPARLTEAQRAITCAAPSRGAALSSLCWPRETVTSSKAPRQNSEAGFPASRVPLRRRHRLNTRVREPVDTLAKPSPQTVKPPLHLEAGPPSLRYLHKWQQHFPLEDAGLPE